MDQVKAKAKDIVDGLSTQTGVDADAVRKVLEALGLESSLLRRVENDSATGGSELANVSMNVVRLTTVQAQI